MRYYLLLLVFCFSFSFTYSQRVIFVNPNAASDGNGSSWQNPFKYLQDAIVEANKYNALEVVQIWMANGTYYADKGKSVNNGDIKASFVIKSNTELYGCFLGNETSLSDRAVDTSRIGTIISGDIGFKNNVDDNTRNLMRMEKASNVVVDAITFRDAYNQYSNLLEKVYSCAMFIENSSVTIRNCLFEYNSSKISGTAINSHYSSINLLRCHFRYNYSLYSDNIAVYIYNSSEKVFVLVDECLFDNCVNGLWISSMASIRRCHFYKNEATSLTIQAGNYEVSDCRFENNGIAGKFGQVYSNSRCIVENKPSNNGKIYNCLFLNNKSASSGSCIYTTTSAGYNDVIANCKFINNETYIIPTDSHIPGPGGTIYSNGPSSIYNSLFCNNKSNGAAGAINASGSLNIYNSTFYNNQSTEVKDGHVLRAYASNSLRIGNCIFYNNGDDSKIFVSEGSAKLAIMNSLLPSNVISYTNSGGNISTVPAFVDPDGTDNVIGTIDDDFRLLKSSPAIDAGDNSLLDLNGDDKIDYFYDLNGFRRISNNFVDMGAFEFGSDLTNHPPSSSIPDIEVLRNKLINYSLAPYIFDVDVASGDAISAKIQDILPSWLTFNESTLVLSGTPTVNGRYVIRLSVFDLNHAHVEDEFIISVVDVHTGISPNVFYGFHITPNPVSTSFKLVFEESSVMPNVVKILSIDGTTLKAFNIVANESIDVSDLPSGLYLVQAILDNKSIHSSKFLKR